MRENEPVMLVLSVCDGEILLEKGEMLSEKRHNSLLILERLVEYNVCLPLLYKSNVAKFRP